MEHKQVNVQRARECFGECLDPMLPTVQPVEKVGPPTNTSRQQPGVLVVDDDPLVQGVVQLSLKINGFKVWLAPGGREAIEFYRGQRELIDVVLLDVDMPGLDGPHTLDALRELNPEVRACFMTGGTAGFSAEELRQRGAACVIAKPFRLDQLARIIWLVAHDVPVDPFPSAGVCQE